MYYSLFFALLLISSRGVFELATSKSNAYAITLFGFIIGVLIFYIFNKGKIRIDKTTVTLVFLFLSSTSISMLYSIYTGIDALYSMYFIYPLVVSVAYLIFYSIDVVIDNNKFRNSIALVIYSLFFAALLQQMYIITLPGDTLTFKVLIRPSSLTGSYLHYPLIMVLYAVVIHSIDKKLTFASIVGYSSVFIGFSRSGMMLVIIILSLYMLHFILSNSYIRINKKYILFLFIGTLTIVILSSYFDFLSLIYERLLSSATISAPGNDGRINAWLKGIEIFSNSNIFFGNNFGTVTNFTGNIIGIKSAIVESGTIQNLINFGLLGTLLFYLFFLNTYIHSNSLVQSYFIIAFFLQSIVYQSTEVLPLIIGTYFLFGVTRKKNTITFKREIDDNTK